MPKTDLQRQTSYYQRIIEEGKNSPQASKYQAMCAALEGLVKASNQLKGSNRVMTAEEFGILGRRYAQVKRACEAYFEEEDKFNDFENSRKVIVKNLSKLLDRDMRALSACDPMQPGTLSDMLKRSRSHRITLDERDVKQVGGVLNKRIPIRANDGTKGFFTVKTVYDPDAQWQKKLEKYEEKFKSVSEECSQKIELLKTDSEFQKSILRLLPEQSISKNYYNDSHTKKRIGNLAYKLGMGKTKEEIEAVFANTKGLYEDLIRFANSARSLVMPQMVMETAGIKKGSEISNRNCAMTSVAKMIGCETLLAKAEPMTIRIGNQDVEGVFMENADGVDLGHLKEKDPIFLANTRSFENPEALLKLADLQVLDFICGNMDRHGLNMTYQFVDDRGKVKFTGIKGFDNDCAFGVPNLNGKEPVMRLVKPNEMAFITTTMIGKLNSINKDLLQETLMGDGLSQEEIDAVMDRIDMVKEVADKQLITSVDKEYFEEHKLADVDVPKNNYFTNLKNLQTKCDPTKGQKLVPNTAQIKYVEEADAAKHLLVNKLADIERLKVMMKNAKAVFISSSEYNIMRKSFERIETLSKEYKELYDSGKRDVAQDKTEQLINAYMEMAEKTERYISLKSLVPSTTRGQNRMEFASELRDFAYGTLTEVSLSTDIEAKKDSEKDAGEPDKGGYEPLEDIAEFNDETLML